MAGRKAPEDSGNGLEFEATLSGVKPVMAKAADGFGRSKAGKLLVELEIEQPVPPALPHELNPGYGRKGFSPRPTEATVNAAPGDSAQLAAAQKRWDDAKATYEAQQAAFGPRMMSYAGLVGLATVLGNQKLRVSMMALESGMLPGFSAQLLPAPTDAVDQDEDE